MCKHLSSSNICQICNMYTFLCFQKTEGMTIPKDVNKIIFEKIKTWEITLYIVFDEITGCKSINLEKNETSSFPGLNSWFYQGEQVNVKFYGDYESFVGFQSWLWISSSYGPSTEILRERNINSDGNLLLYDVDMGNYCFTSPNYSAFISGVVEGMRFSNIWTLENILKNIYTVSPKIVKFCNVKKTAIEQLKRETGENFDGHDISKLKEKLKKNNEIKLTPQYIDQAMLDYPCKFVY